MSGWHGQNESDIFWMGVTCANAHAILQAVTQAVTQAGPAHMHKMGNVTEHTPDGLIRRQRHSALSDLRSLAG